MIQYFRYIVFITAIIYCLLYGVRKTPALSKLFIKIHKFTDSQLRSVKKKVIVITGGTDGIGRIFTQEMHKNGAIVIFCGRSLIKAEYIFKQRHQSEFEATSTHLISRDKTLVFKKVDLSDLNEVENFTNFVEEFLKSQNLDRIDSLFNNAGMIVQGFKKTKQNLEMMIGMNNVSHFVITDKFLPLLKKSKDPRVVTTGSIMAIFTNIDNISFQGNKNQSITGRYNNSKLLSAIHMKLMSKIEKDVLFLSFHPGLVRTSIIRNFPIYLQFLSPIGRLLFRSVFEGAQTMLKLSYTNRKELVNGAYYNDNGDLSKLKGEDSWTVDWLKEKKDIVRKLWKDW